MDIESVIGTPLTMAHVESISEVVSSLNLSVQEDDEKEVKQSLFECKLCRTHEE